MDMKQLAFFVEANKQGSIQRASEVLHISPSGLRLSLHRLEDELDTSLICWGAKSFELTSNGEYFVEQAKHILHIYENCTMHFKLSSRPSIVSIASGINFPSRAIGDIFLDFSDAHPKFKATLSDYSAGQCDDAVRRGICEIGFNTGPFNSTEFEYFPLFDYSLHVVINTTDPVSHLDAFPIARLVDYSLTLADVKPGDTMFADYCAEKGITPDIMSRIKRDSVIFRSVAIDRRILGITHKEAFYGLSIPQVRIMPFEGKGFKKTVYMFHRKDSFLSPPARAYKEFVLEKVRSGAFQGDF